jgi:sodium-dependent dicarboxylate transporter 2/3/5
MSTRKILGLILGLIAFFIPLAVRFDGLSSAGHIALSILLLAACFWILEPIPIYATSMLVIFLGAALLSGQGPVYRNASLPLIQPKAVGGGLWEVPATAVTSNRQVYLEKGKGEVAAVAVTVEQVEGGTARVKGLERGDARIVSDSRHPLAGYRPSSVADYFNTLANPIIILFLGGLLMADAAVKFNLDKNLTRLILRPFGTRPSHILLGLLAVTGLISAFMSNTATTAMMMTVVLPIIAQLEPEDPLRRAVVLAIPIGANIGGIATPVGTPPNAVALAALAKAGRPIPFGTWVLTAAPVAILGLLVAWRVLVRLFPSRREEFALQMTGSFDRSPKAILLYVIGGITVVLWVTEAVHGVSSSLVALFTVAALTVTGVVDRTDIEKIPWDVLWLVSGGIALDIAMQSTGLGAWLISKIPWGQLGKFLVVAVFALVAFAMAQILSHTISATLIVPLAVNVGLSGAGGQGFNLAVTCVVVGIGVSFGMSLPISTPPNAIAVSTGMVDTRDMARAGVIIGIAGIALMLILAQWYWPAVLP